MRYGRLQLSGLGLLTFLLASLAQPVLAQTVPPDVPANRAASVTPAAPVLTTKIDVVRLDSGAKLVVLYDPQAKTVVAEAFFQVSLADEKRMNGVNALIARMWTGESEARSAALLQRDVAQIGGIGSGLGHDWLELWGVSGASEYDVRESLRAVFTNLVAAPRFSREFVDQGKADLTRTAALERDVALSAVLAALRSRVFSESVYGRSLWGNSDVLKPEEITEYYHRYFRPDRAVFVLAGPIPAATAKQWVENSLGAGGWRNDGQEAPTPPRITPETVPAGLRPLVMPLRAPATITALGYIAPGTENTRRVDWATLLVLDAVLGGGKASRLFHALRDNSDPIGYDVRTTLLPGRGQSLWAAYVVGNRPGESVRAALSGELSALATGAQPVTETEVDRARAYLLARHLEERQRLQDRAWGAGWSELMGLGADFDTDLAARVALVSADDVNRLARELLRGHPAVVYTLPGG